MFQQALEQTLIKLNDAKDHGLLSDFALIGGLAVSRWTAPRATEDIDIAIRIEGDRVEPLADFLHADLQKGGPADPLDLVMNFEVCTETAPIEVQLIQFPPAIASAVFRDIAATSLGALTVPVVDWKALVLLKVYAGGQQDLLDAASIIESVTPGTAERQYLEETARSLRLSRRLSKVLA